MSFSNTSSYKDELSQVTLTDAGLSVMALFLALFITSANATTIMAIWRTPALRTLANTYVCSLACADFIVGLVCVLLALFMLPPVRLELFYKHIEVCSLFQGTTIGMSALSAIHMTLIAVDRYLYIIQPYFYQRVVTLRVISVFICMAWVIGLVLSFLPQFTTVPYGDVPLCDITARQPVWYTFYTCTVLFSALCVVNLIMYSIILHAAGKQRRAVRATAPVPQQNGKVQGKGDNEK
ncbi:beta-1 adrenergic receptor [Elysia marginata]|uniref:Beta-1 adrenergic receptor n=1 Tax=Elysia marginata TaxID=1093978 RepID=A0AAV4FJF2_9GAST|nr:beta-1 adrenergic receptor [Elysia marginata]